MEISFQHLNLSLDEWIDSAWSVAKKDWTPRELHRWRKGLFSVFVGHLPYDINKVRRVGLDKITVSKLYSF